MKTPHSSGPEAEARKLIDAKLVQSGWVVQDRDEWAEDAPEGRWRCYTYDEVISRDKASLDIFWLRDESLEDSASLPDPNVIAQEIADDLRAALEQIEDVLGDLEERSEKVS